MDYKEFMKSHTTVDEDFLDTFLQFYTENTLPSDIIIDLEIVADWLEAKEKSLRRTLRRSYKENVDYTVERVKFIGLLNNKKGGKRYEDIVKISSDVLKRLCLLTRSRNGELVRSYYIQLENLVMRYHNFIRDGLREQLGIKNKNKEYIKNAKGGVLYILKADDDPTAKDVYKFGKTDDLAKRMATYNTGRAKDIEILFIYQVKYLERAERCVKNQLEDFQYKNKKEIYQVDLHTIKEIIEKCAECELIYDIAMTKININNKQSGGQPVKFSILTLPL
jgi:hypothetical protein